LWIESKINGIGGERGECTKETRVSVGVHLQGGEGVKKKVPPNKKERKTNEGR